MRRGLRSRGGDHLPMHQSEKWNDVGGQSRLRPRHRRLVSGRDHREPNRLARHIARRLLLPGSRLRRADVPECLEHGRLCYPPHMPCRLTACSQSLHGQRLAPLVGEATPRQLALLISYKVKLTQRYGRLDKFPLPTAVQMRGWELSDLAAPRPRTTVITP